MGVGTGSVSSVGLAVGARVGTGWFGTTGGATAIESLKVVTPLDNKVGVAVGERTGVDVDGGTVGRGTSVDVGGGMVGVLTSPWTSQADTEPNKTSTRPQVPQIRIRGLTNFILMNKLAKGPPYPNYFLD